MFFNKELDAGSYLLTVKVTNEKQKAGRVAAVHIYPSLTTTYTETFTEDDLLLNVVIKADGIVCIKDNGGSLMNEDFSPPIKT